MAIVTPADSSIRSFAFGLSELKRQFSHEDGLSTAGDLFQASWSMLAAGRPAADVCAYVTGSAIAGLSLGSLRSATLASLLGNDAEHAAVLHRAYDASCPALPDDAHLAFRRGLVGHVAPAPPSLPFVRHLLRQPRAGATALGQPRITLLPQENHGEHCLAVAVLAAVLASAAGADPVPAFLAGLAHHLHNARLPDAGFAGEVMLGAALDPLVRRLTDAELATLASPLCDTVAAALRLVGDVDSAEGRAFNAADVIDRVVQQHCHERSARFSARSALEEFDLVHQGPLQSFGQAVLREHDLL